MEYGIVLKAELKIRLKVTWHDRFSLHVETLTVNTFRLIRASSHPLSPAELIKVAVSSKNSAHLLMFIKQLDFYSSSVNCLPKKKHSLPLDSVNQVCLQNNESNLSEIVFQLLTE